MPILLHLFGLFAASVENCSPLPTTMFSGELPGACAVGLPEAVSHEPS